MAWSDYKSPQDLHKTTGGYAPVPSSGVLNLGLLRMGPSAVLHVAVPAPTCLCVRDSLTQLQPGDSYAMVLIPQKWSL